MQSRAHFIANTLDKHYFSWPFISAIALNNDTGP